MTCWVEGCGLGKWQKCGDRLVQERLSVVARTGHSVAYICGSCDFSATRLQQLLLLSQQVKAADVSVVMEKVHVFRVFDVFELLLCLEELRTAVISQVDSYHANLKLVVVDPVTLYLSPLLGSKQGRGMIGQVGRALKNLATQLRLAVLCVNNVVVGVAEGGGVKGALGQSWASIPSIRLRLALCCVHSTPHLVHGDLSSLATPTTSRLLTISMTTREVTGPDKAVFIITDAGLVPN